MTICSRGPLWQEAARLDILTASGAYKPIGQALSPSAQQHLRTLVDDLKQRDISFCAERVGDGLALPAQAAADYLLSAPPRFPWGLRVEGAGFNRLQVNCLDDLRTLEAVYVTGMISTLSDPPLAAALQMLDTHSQEFYKTHLTDEGTFNWGDHRVHKFGVYGAYKELTSGKLVGSRDLLMAEKCGMGTAIGSRATAVALPLQRYHVAPPLEDSLRVFESLAASRLQMEPSQSPGKGAAADYELVQRYLLPGQSLQEAADSLTSIQLALQPRHGWEASHRAFAFLQDGLRQGRFATQDRDEALLRYLQAAVVSTDLDSAQDALFREGGSSPPRVVRDENRLTINGTAVPVRSST